MAANFLPGGAATYGLVAAFGLPSPKQQAVGVSENKQPMNKPSYSPTDLLGQLNSWELKNAPEFLYAAGDISLLIGTLRVSVVGARAATTVGIQRARNLADILVKNDMIVVSGLAKGIDKAAHDGALASGGRTIAVIGTPLEKAYPAAHRALQDRIAREHLVVSQFPPGGRVFPSSFPMRNRTMALISHATVIVEAGAKSGCISQGWEALRLGRELFITRSLADDPESRWTDDLREYGAQVLDDPEEFVDALPHGLRCISKRVSGEAASLGHLFMGAE